MKIQALGYDSEADELDLLIDTDVPQPAEAIPLDAGVYIRRDPESGRVVGAFVRGYTSFLQTVMLSADGNDEAENLFHGSEQSRVRQRIRRYCKLAAQSPPPLP